MHIVCRASASMQSHTPFHRMRLHEQPTSLYSHQQLYLVATETPISANSRLHTRLLRDDFSGPSASPRPTASSASRPSHSGRLSKTWPGLNRSVRRLYAIKPCHEVSSGTYSTLPKYAKEKTKKKMPNSGCNNFSITSGHLPIIRRVRHSATTTAVSAYVLCHMSQTPGLGSGGGVGRDDRTHSRPLHPYLRAEIAKILQLGRRRTRLPGQARGEGTPTW